jgi:LruC domain-containing protein
MKSHRNIALANRIELFVLFLAVFFAVACAPVHFVGQPLSAPATQGLAPATPGLVQYPSQGSFAAVAFEDNYPRPGDGDYNDFLTNFRITEKINPLGQITEIIVDFYPRALGASYDHQFLLVLNGKKDLPSNISLQTSPLFNGGARVQLTHFDASGNLLDVQNNLSAVNDIVVFNSTHAIFGFPSGSMSIVNTLPAQPYIPAMQNARVDIVLIDPSQNPVAAAGIDLAKFRMILHVKNTGQDIDTINSDPSNFDSNGNPFGFVIPASWQWPTEGTSIGAIYPSFLNYRTYLLQLAIQIGLVIPQDVQNWFNAPIGGSIGLYPLIAAPRLLPDP